MRSRHDIVDEWHNFSDSSLDISTTVGLDMVIELLLDIRDLLDARPAVKYPESPPPPEVKR